MISPWFSIYITIFVKEVWSCHITSSFPLIYSDKDRVSFFVSKDIVPKNTFHWVCQRLHFSILFRKLSNDSFFPIAIVCPSLACCISSAKNKSPDGLIRFNTLSIRRGYQRRTDIIPIFLREFFYSKCLLIH